MSYKKANGVLPPELLKQVQEYIDGEYIYIPRKESEKRKWGETTNIKKELSKRNMKIYRDYISGSSFQYLAEKYFLSIKSIQRIIYQNNK